MAAGEFDLCKAHAGEGVVGEAYTAQAEEGVEVCKGVDGKVQLNRLPNWRDLVDWNTAMVDFLIR